MLNKYKQKYEVPKHLQEAYQIKDHIFSFSYLLNISHAFHTKLSCSSYCNCQAIYLVYCGDTIFREKNRWLLVLSYTVLSVIYIGCKCMCIITIKDSSFSLLYCVTFSLLIANKGFHFFLHSRVSSKNNQNLYACIYRYMLAFISGSNATSNGLTFTQFYVDQSNDQSNFDKI